MIDINGQNWWAIALRGVAIIIFGILALVWPALTLFVLVLLFTFCAIADGILAIFAGIISRRYNGRWWTMVLGGVGGIIIGILIILWPNITALALLYFIAAWAFVTGILQIASAIRLRHTTTNEWMVIFNGIVSIIFGLLLLFLPGPGALSLIWLISTFTIIVGTLLIIQAFRLRSEGDRNA